MQCIVDQHYSVLVKEYNNENALGLVTLALLIKTLFLLVSIIKTKIVFDVKSVDRHPVSQMVLDVESVDRHPVSLGL